METASNKSHSLLKIWNSEEGKKQNYSSLRTELRRTLEQNLAKEFTGEEDTKLLEEFRSTFEWETEITLSIDWEYFGYGTQGVQLSVSKEEATDYLNGNKEPEQPSYNLDLGEVDFTGDYEKEVVIYVRNLRLKEKNSEYSVSFVVDCSEGADALQEILNAAFQSPIQKLELVPIVS